MNFFDRQSVKRRQSLILLLCFIVALGCMGAVIHVSIAGLSYLLGETDSFSNPSTPALALIGLVWLMIFAGAFFRALDVRAGGAVLARRFGAVHASDRSRFDKEQLLLNVVAEISIASTTPQPDVFVLRSESSINAFVLGMPPNRKASRRNVIVVTQGALDAFDRDELKAVVAHEFGHIANNDLPLNMHLLMALGGLMAIDEVGRLLVGENPNDNAHPGVIVGYLLRALGSLGVFFGRVIRAAFSRQREYLADAMAVQYTRNPFALASALSIVQERDEPALHGAYAEELAHLCFQSSARRAWYKRLLATHPALEKRIAVIEPHFAVKKRQSRPKNSDAHEAGKRSMSAVSGAASPTLVGHDEPIGDSNSTGQELSDRVALLMPDEKHCVAVLFALFASNDVNKQRDYLNALAFGFNANFSMTVKSMLKEMPEELQRDQLVIIEHATAVLKASLKHENRQRILLKLERLLTVGGDYSLMNYATLQLVRRKLDVEFPLIDTLATEQVAEGRRAKAFDAMGDEFALLLSLMVESSGAPPAVQDQEFNRVLKCYTQTRYPRRTGAETGIVEEVEAAFQTLYVQPESIRQAFVQHCVEIVQRDGYVAPSERALLGLFAASLGCEAIAA